VAALREATAFPPIGDIARHSMFLPRPSAFRRSRPTAASAPRTRSTLLERGLKGKDYIVGKELTGADIMMGYFLMAARMLGCVGAEHPNVAGVLGASRGAPGVPEGAQRVAEAAMLVVHHLNDSRSQRILWLLEELEVPYEIKTNARNATTRLAPPELKAVHPLGKSPVITDGGPHDRRVGRDRRLRRAAARQGQGSTRSGVAALRRVRALAALRRRLGDPAADVAALRDLARAAATCPRR
jgi:glutathione S-transferase